MSSPIQRSNSFSEDVTIKTFRAKERCHKCWGHVVTTVLQKLSETEAIQVCSKCLTEEFKASQEVKIKKLKRYSISPIPESKDE